MDGIVSTRICIPNCITQNMAGISRPIQHSVINFHIFHENFPTPNSAYFHFGLSQMVMEWFDGGIAVYRWRFFRGKYWKFMRLCTCLSTCMCSNTYPVYISSTEQMWIAKTAITDQTIHMLVTIPPIVSVRTQFMHFFFVLHILCTLARILEYEVFKLCFIQWFDKLMGNFKYVSIIIKDVRLMFIGNFNWFYPIE